MSTDTMTEPRISRASLIAQLDIGEAASFAEQIDPSATLESAMASVTEIAANLRNNVMTSVRQAMARTGGSYKCEVGPVVMPQRSVWVIAIVSRTD